MQPSKPPSRLSSLNRHIVLSPAVHSALQSSSPVIALESTIISHGMPYPQNVETARRVEDAARSLRVTPATIAVLDGKICVGLTDEQLQRLGRLGLSCRKCSRRDLALIIAQGGNGSTTVAATMLIAATVGIRIFATGGVGGVHRGVEQTMDISADLQELSRTSVAVVCAGVKSILDIPRTLEYLETGGVPVLTLSSNPAAPFPAFFSTDSGCPSPAVLPTVRDCAAVVLRQAELGLSTGLLIAVPVPAEAAGDGARMEAATCQALQEAEAKGIRGSEVTPFLLLRIAELTGNDSLAANIALILNNVRVAAQLAIELQRMEADSERENSTVQSSSTAAALTQLPTASSPSPSSPSPPSVIVCGAINQDIIGRPAPDVRFLLGTSSPGRLERHLGGVGRNIAETLARLELAPLLVAAVGDDREGELCVEQCAAVGIRTEAVVRLRGHRTSTYVAIMTRENDVLATIADMEISDSLTPELLPTLPFTAALRIIVLDCNLPADSLAFIASAAFSHGVPVLLEPTSVENSARAAAGIAAGLFSIIAPSAGELLAMAERAGYPPARLSTALDAYLSNDDNGEVEKQAALVLSSIRPPPSHPSRFLHLVVKRGSRGVLLASRCLSSEQAALLLHSERRPRLPPGDVVSTSGAGDSLVGAMVARLVEEAGRLGDDVEAMRAAVRQGMIAAELTLKTHKSVSADITRKRLKEMS